MRSLSRLSQRSGETLSLLQKVRTDTERFINAFINVVFSSLVGVWFLIWYAVTEHWALIPVFLIGVLVLGASKDPSGPGPLVANLAGGKLAGSFPVPITVVPGHLTTEEILGLA